MKVIGRTTDRWGRAIELTEARWRHILDRHPDLANQMADVLSIVARPDVVNFDADHAGRENAYRTLPSEGSKHPSYLKVCVEYGPTDGTIITAHPTHRIKHREQIKWP